MERVRGRIVWWQASSWVGAFAAIASLASFGASNPGTNGTITPAGSGSSVTLAWDPNPDPSVSGYRVYSGLASRNYTLVYDAGNTTNLTVPGLLSGVIYYFAATDYNTNGLESDFSAEVVYTNGTALQIASFVRTADGNFSVSGFGVAGQICVLLATTNPTPPVIWTPILTNAADAQGSFSLVDLQATNYPSRFYTVMQPGAALGPIPLALHR